jgi:hypothetical protein
MNNITTILKEATNDLLTEDVLKQIEEAFDQAVNDRVSINVEKALTEQDESHAGKLEKLLEALDRDHTNKLEKVVRAVSSNHAQKLKQVVGKYETTLNEEAGNFKSDLVDQISNYIDVYLEAKIPDEEIKEAVKNKKAHAAITQLRESLGVDLALSQDTIRTAIIDGKQQLSESTEVNEKLIAEKQNLQQELLVTRSNLLLSEKVKDFTNNKQKYIFKVLSGKSEKFINENFDYTVNLFEKTEEQRLEQYKDEAVKETQTVDRPIVEKVDEQAERVINESAQHDSSFSPAYMSELSKW